MSRRLYLGKLPHDTRSDDVTKVFDGYGRIIDCRVMTGFGFIEYENAKDAEDALRDFANKPFMGANIVVEFAKESRPRRDPYDDRRAPRARRPQGIRILIQNLHRDVSWQDLKDFGREAGNVSFSDIDRDVPGQGVLEYLTRDDADRAVKELDGREVRGMKVSVALDDSRSGPDNYRRDERRDDRRDDRYRDDRYSSRDDRGYGREDRYREDRYRDDRSYSSRRERSRSPRRDYDDRRPARSPPPKRDYEERRSTGYDDYRRSAYDDRRVPDYPERRRDDRRRDEKDDRYEDRPARSANGDGGWSR
ncbi:hypothetical protein CPB85DRAFT_1376056 [Mucidula mucida]|nr:hypothetical protein CPB85DRAFT_1376056 [Mucidula mucida]